MTQSFLANLPWVLLAALGSFAVYKIGDGKAEAIGRLEAASAKLAAMEAEAERTRQLHQELAAAKLVEQQLAARAQEAETRLATAAKEAETRTAAESDEEQLRTAVAVQVALQLASQQPEAPASDVAAPPEAPPEASCEGNGTLPRGLPHMLSGIAKWELQAGKPGTQSPRGADEVSLDFECTQEEAPLHAGTEVPHRMGDLEDAALLPGLDAALRSMLPGERAFFSLAPTDALGARVEALGGAPQATVHCAVALLSLTQIEDVSAMADRSVLKTQLAAGRGVETPKDGAQVVVRAAAYAPNGSYLNGTTNGSEWRMALGDGRCSEGLRLGLMSMRRAESARLNISAHMARDPTLGLAADEAVVVEVELLAFSQARALDQMSEAELAEHVGAIKEAANKMHAAGERGAACAEYERGWHLLRAYRTAPGSGAEAETNNALEVALRLNSAACAQSDGRHAEALAHADAALALSSNSTKAHYRKGQALRGLGRLAEAEAAFTAVLAIDPRNRQAHAELTALAEASTAAAATAAVAS